MVTLIDAEGGFTARQLGIGETVVFADGAVGNVVEDGELARFEVSDDADAYAWATSVTRTDAGDAPWRQITTTFDENGAKLSQDLIFDDGRVSETSYASGVRERSVSTDPNDARSWSRIESTYDEGGAPLTSAVTYDDTTTAWTNFENGVRANTTRFDEGDVRSWETIYTVFEDGVRDVSYLTQDDGDVITTRFEDGVRSEVVFFDGSDTRPWETRTATYDAEGNVLDVVLA